MESEALQAEGCDGREKGLRKPNQLDIINNLLRREVTSRAIVAIARSRADDGVASTQDLEASRTWECERDQCCGLSTAMQSAAKAWDIPEECLSVAYRQHEVPDGRCRGRDTYDEIVSSRLGLRSASNNHCRRAQTTNRRSTGPLPQRFRTVWRLGQDA